MEKKMREIKFRAWDIERECFCDGAICFNYDDYYWVVLNENYEQILSSYSGILMQFTGLKDANGKDIYEGDIVKVWNGNKTTINHDGFQFCVGKSMRVMRKSEASSMIVIGNIYETPELMEKVR